MRSRKESLGLNFRVIQGGSLKSQAKRTSFKLLLNWKTGNQQNKRVSLNSYRPLEFRSWLVVNCDRKSFWKWNPSWGWRQGLEEHVLLDPSRTLSGISDFHERQVDEKKDGHDALHIHDVVVFIVVVDHKRVDANDAVVNTWYVMQSRRQTGKESRVIFSLVNQQ
jgi:hypothetical protein